LVAATATATATATADAAGMPARGAWAGEILSVLNRLLSNPVNLD